ncbi:phosphatidate cytidylyltransferase [Anaerospora sp.]|uniref:phosphatidate cytidylyltransferase n=1 Tax=Anaerospora sp. TaxID=1960278 RepID=UPI00289E8355|nr:phosphatidate cytidylyltransferase [Anaerospora sp.]
MLAKRIATALVGIPVAVYVINYGQWLFGLTVSFLALAAWHEYCVMVEQNGIYPSKLLGLIGVALVLGCAWVGNSQETVTVLTLISLIILGKTVISYGKFSLVDAALTLLGLLYIALPFSHLLLLRFLEPSLSSTSAGMTTGAMYLWIAFVGTWASDTFAYLVGSKFGKAKLCPAISPGKTREGAIGGLFGSIFAVLILGHFFHIALIHSFFMGVFVGLVAPLGDLVESSLKRYCCVKDSGRLLPGHGGVLDRFDSIMFAVPAVYYYVEFFLIR